jgi:uncharacterized protein YfeS
MDSYYFDDPEEGITRETSHPFFVSCATSDFYYDLGDDFSPFGNDAGADMLFRLQDWFNECSQKEDITNFLLEFLEANHPGNIEYIKLSEPRQLSELDTAKQIYCDDIDQFIIATAFGQCKIAGLIDIDLFIMADKALLRQQYLTKAARQKENNPWLHATRYLQRIEVMQTDLTNMATKKPAISGLFC